MIKSGSTPRLTFIGAKIESLARFKWLFSLVVAVVFTVAATPPADQRSPDEQYIQIMTLIDKGDALRAAGQTEAAKTKYRDAQKALLYFKAVNPLFAPKTVTYRLNELSTRLETHPVMKTSSSNAPAAKLNLEAESSGSKTEVKLIDAGAEPHKALRFHITPGDKQSILMTVKVNIDMAAAATNAPAAGAPPAAPMSIPAITIPLEVMVQNLETNGDVTYQAVVGEVSIADDTDLPPQAVQAMKAVFAGIKGSVTGVVTSTGLSKKVDAKLPPGADLQVRQIFELIKGAMTSPGLPLPTDAIGGGAKWTVKMPSKSQGTAGEATSAFELVSVDGDHLKATFTLNFNSANAKAGDPALASETGTIEADLSKVVASQVTVDRHTDIPPSKQQPTGAKMDLHVTVESK